MAGPVPRYGTWVMWVPMATSSTTQARWVAEPVPAEP